MVPPKECPSLDIMNVREIIECAFGDFYDNKVNFKLVQTVLLLIARQLRVLERRVEVEMGPYLPLPPENTLSITEVKVHATQKKGKKKKAGQPSSGSEKTSSDKTSTDKRTSTDKTNYSTDNKKLISTDKTTTSTDRTSTDKNTSLADNTTTTSTGQTSTDKNTSSTDKTTTSTGQTSTDKNTSSTDKTTTTSTGQTSTDKNTSSTDKTTTTSTGQTSTDKTRSSTDKTTTTSTDWTSTDKTTSSSDRKTKEISSRTAAAARGQKPYSNPDILIALEEQRERELRIIHQRADSFEEAAKSPTPMASVSSIYKSEAQGRRKTSDIRLGTKKKEKEEAKKSETLLVVKKVPSKESRSGETGQQRSPHISVVTQEQFEELAKAVRQLEKKFLPIGTPGFPEHAELMEELRKGASLTDAMAALQLSARLEATEKVLGQMITMITDLASQPPVVGLDDLTSKSKKLTFTSTAKSGQSQREYDGQSQRELDGQSQRELDGQSPRVLNADVGVDGVTPISEAGPERSSIGGAAKSSKSLKGVPSFPTASTIDKKTAMGFAPDEEESDDESKDSVYVNFKDLRTAARELYDELLKKLKAETTRTTSTAESAYRLSTNLESKLDRAKVVTSRMTELENVVKQYADQVTALDTGLSSQMTSYQEQLTQMQHDLEIGVETISELLASSSGDVEAVAELHSNFTNLHTDFEVMAFRQKELKDSQNSTAYDLENLWKEIEMLRDTKADREEVTDALRDKAGIGQLNGLVALQQFEAVRGDFEKRIGAAYDKFNNQEHVWQKAIDELVKVLNEKGDLIQVETLRDDINQHLNRIKARIQIIADIVGEPKSAMVNKKVFRDTSCLSCGSPAHMDLEEPNKVPALPKFPSGREPAEGAEGESLTQGGGDSRLCYPDMPIPHPRDPRSHICKRYCGGSHTNITDGLNRTLPGLVVQPANRTLNTAPGTDGKLYMVDEQTKKVPCLACNMPTPPSIIFVPEPPKQDPIDSFDEHGGVCVTPPAQNVPY